MAKMGASASLLTATIVLEVCMPARCWMAPEMPTATYSWGDTVLPVWPTWCWWGYQPASTAARLAPTAAPRESARASTRAKLDGSWRPRPADLLLDDVVGHPDRVGGLGAQVQLDHLGLGRRLGDRERVGLDGQHRGAGADPGA